MLLVFADTALSVLPYPQSSLGTLRLSVRIVLLSENLSESKLNSASSLNGSDKLLERGNAASDLALYDDKLIPKDDSRPAGFERFRVVPKVMRINLPKSELESSRSDSELPRIPCHALQLELTYESYHIIP